MARLLIGPLLRHVGERDATVWVETDEPCEVEVRGRRARTFEVEGHHYALVVVDGLEPGRAHPYAVACDGVERWPEPDHRLPAPAIRTLGRDGPLRLVWGSCRAAAPHVAPFALSPDESPQGLGRDALRAYALRMAAAPAESWPHALVLLGDQVYADEASPETRAFIRSRRDTSEPPGEQVADFEEYARLYRESWSDETIRWLLAAVPSSMIFDDHDVHDDWNTSASWVEDFRAQPWWEARITGAFVSYWVYQHLGNLGPGELERDETWRAVRACDGDAGPLLRDFARRADRGTDGTQWSFHRDFGRTRLVVVDSRAGRVLREDRREMVDEAEWAWIVEQASAGADHLLLGSSLPFLLPPGIHGLEAWNEALCAGAWGPLAARVSERIRRGVDLEHWAAFQASFRKLAELLREVAAGERGRAPETILGLSGDVHYAYLAEADLGAAGGCRVFQAVCSPFRNPLRRRERLAQRLGLSRVGEAIGTALARSAGVRPAPVRWRVADGPWFGNCVGSLELEGPRVRLRIERAAPGLATVLDREL